MKKLFLLLVLFLACNQKKNETFFFENGVFVINEGNFTYGNASISFIDLQKDSVFNDVFYKANNLPLGDVAQSGFIKDSLLWIVVNNSGKIYVINRFSAKYKAQIIGLNSPRYILPINENLAYVSDLYSNYITIVDLNTFEKISTIDVGCSTEQMILFNGYVYACNWTYGNKVLKINPESHSLEAVLEVQYQPNSLVVDKDGFLWVLSDGGNNSDTSENQLPALTKIDLSAFRIDTIFYFASRQYSPTHLTIDQQKENLYFLNSSWNGSEKGGIFKMNIYSDHLPKSPIISEKDALFYSFAIDENDNIWVSDAIDYLQRGKVYQYDPKGNLKAIYKVGIIPSYFIFVK